MKSHLHRRIYLTLIGVVAISLLFAAISARLLLGPSGLPPGAHDAVIQLLAGGLPPADAPVAAQREALAEAVRDLPVSVSLLGPDGEPLAAVGERLPAPDLDAEGPVWSREWKSLARWERLPDGRWLGVATAPDRGGLPAHLGVLAVVLVVMAVGAHKVARLITKRLERLRAGVEAWGSGSLSARVPVEGLDEVADLAKAFNAAAERVEALVEQQKGMLASASHELRSPLARVQMALELLADDPNARDDTLFDGARRDIAELDGLIGDLLLASRLDAKAPLSREPVDVRTLIEEEAERVGARVAGPSDDDLGLFGETGALRRLVRNLLENARRFSDDVELHLESSDGVVRLVVDDGGPGVPEAERERIFEPFYRRAGHREGRHGGVGLGLTLVRRVAEAHGGRAFCTDRPGGGGRFVVELPRRE